MRQKGCLFFAFLSLVPLQVDCNFFSPFLLYVRGCYTPSELLTGESCLSLGKQFSSLGRGLEMPRYFFFCCYHNTFPPSILYLYTDSSYFYTHCKTINKSCRYVGLKMEIVHERGASSNRMYNLNLLIIYYLVSNCVM